MMSSKDILISQAREKSNQSNSFDYDQITVETINNLVKLLTEWYDKHDYGDNPEKDSYDLNEKKLGLFIDTFRHGHWRRRIPPNTTLATQLSKITQGYCTLQEEEIIRIPIKKQTKTHLVKEVVWQPSKSRYVAILCRREN